MSSFKSDLNSTSGTINDEVSSISFSDEKLSTNNETSASQKSNDKQNVSRKLFDDSRRSGQGDGDQIVVIDNETKQSPGEEKIKIYRTLEEFDQNLPDTVTLLTTDAGAKVYLVGTAHFSENSQDDVSFVIRNVQPHIVMVELCGSRVHILRHDEKTLLEEAKDINFSKIRNIISSNGLINGALYILLLSMSAKITKELGMAPGGEFRRAVAEVHRLPNCLVHLGDRPISITLQRALHGLSFYQTLKLVWKLISFDEEITPEEVEQCKQKDLLEELMKDMVGEFPAFGDVFVHERDLYLCHSLQVAALPQDPNQAPRVVGVVGIGHAKGIAENWGKVTQDQIAKIVVIPPASLGNRVFKFTIKYGTLALIGYGVFRLIRPRLKNIW